MKNRGEEIFGQEALIGKVLIAIEECSRQSNIPAEFILQVGSASGQDQVTPLVISRKNKIQKAIHINQPLILVGNSAPSLPNEQNQFQRRMRGFLFDRPVPAEVKDPQLPQKLRKEFPAFLRGCNLGYHNMIRGFVSDLEKHTPKDLARDTAEIINSTDETRQFMESDLIKYDKLGIKSRKVIPLEVLVNEFSKFKTFLGVSRKHRLVTKKEIYAILEISQAKVLVCSDTDAKVSDFFGFPTYALGWPFLRGLHYSFETNQNHHVGIDRKFAYVIGIELNYISNPRIAFTNRMMESEENRSSRPFFTKLFSYKRKNKFLKSIDFDEKENIDKFFAAVENSITWCDGQRGSILQRTSGRKAFREMRNSNVTDENGLSVYDYFIIREIGKRVNIDIFTETGQIQLLDLIDGKRFFRFEVYSLFQRVRSRVKSFPLLKSLVNLLGKMLTKPT